ncbi:MAG: DUF4352 domain-containing protein [Thermoplasmatota archaeon]
MTLQNKGAVAESVNPLYFHLATSDGVSRDYSSDTYSESNPLQSADVLPGGSLKGDLDFQVPDGVKIVSLCFNNGNFDGFCVAPITCPDGSCGT